MAVKRLASDKERIKLHNSKIHKGKDITKMSQVEKDDLLKILAEQAGIL
jgi:hypothetical protein